MKIPEQLKIFLSGCTWQDSDVDIDPATLVAASVFKVSHFAVYYWVLCETSPNCIPKSDLNSDTYPKDRNEGWGVE